jgi:hypothetical protein
MRRLIFVAMFVFACGDNKDAPLDGGVDGHVDAQPDAKPDAPMLACTTASDCNDNNGCTTDTCSSANVCEHTPKVIDDQIACTTDACDPTTGNVTHTPVNTVCEVDGKTCTVATCSATTGCSETPTANVCDDGATCSTDRCDPTANGADATTGCVYTLNDTACADAVACTANTCSPTAVASDPTTGCLVVVDNGACDDGVACTSDTCDMATGCSHQANNSVCEVDGKSCTVATCNVTTGCSETETDSLCNDNATCTTDSCSSVGPGATGCIFNRNDAACADTAECSTDACSPGTAGADATTGCLYTADATVCSTNAMCSSAFDCVCNNGYMGDGLTCTMTPGACDALSNPANGMVSVSNGGVFPSTATYTCNTGFAALTSLTRSCNMDGTWTGAAPVCDPTFFVVRVGDGAAALGATSTAVFLEERDVAGVVLRTIPLPTATAGANAPFTLQGTSTAEGGLSRATNGAYVTLGGYAAVPGIASVNGTVNRSTDATPTNRVVARVAADGTVDTSTRMLDAFSAASIRGVSTVDGTAFWASGTSSGTPATGGVQYTPFGATGSTTLISSTQNNLRHTHVFGSQLYVSSGAGTTTRGVMSVGTGTPTTTGQTANPLVILPGSLAANSFAVLDLDPVVTGVDTIYVAYDSGGVAGVVNVQKWTFNGTLWTQAAFAPTVTGTAVPLAIGLTSWVDGTSVHLIVTTNESPARILHIVDDGATTAPAASVLATAATNTAFRGAARSPTQ